MGIQELEEVEPGVTPEKLGTIFHSTAESFYNRWKGKDPGRISPLERDAATGSMIEATLEVLGRYSYSGPYWDAVRERLLGDGKRAGMVQGFIESEAGYAGAFKVARTELRFGMPGEEGGPPPIRLGEVDASGEMGTFLFRGSMDRVDTLDLGDRSAFFIWDYKTGSTDEDRKGLQVPLYLLAASKLLKGRSPAGGGYYYVQRPGAIWRDIRLGAELWDAPRPTSELLEEAASSSQTVMKEALETALDLIGSARGGSFPPKENCKENFCPYSDICRRGER
jgi:ATP-dependent helicase/DNAse subunit B